MGHVGGFFAALGADVTSLEGRINNINFANLCYGSKYRFKSIYCDLEKDFSDLGRFDFIINFGLLEVIKNIDLVLSCCVKMSDDIFLETIVCDSLEAKVMQVTYDPSDIDQDAHDPSGIDNPMYGTSSYPSPLYIENFFKEKNFIGIPYFHADLNTPKHT